MEAAESVVGISYPNLVFSHGHLPPEPPPKRFEESADKDPEEVDENWEEDWGDDPNEEWY